jgi:adhesin transport system outer membrane protein
LKWIQISLTSSTLLWGCFAHSQSLEQAIELTLATNPEIKSSYNEYMSYVRARDAIGGEYLPSIDFEAGVGYEGIDSDSTSRTNLARKDATLSLTQLIWDGSTTLNNMDRTAAEAESMRFQLLSDAENKALEVSKIYLDALKAYEILRLSESNLKTHKQIYKDIEKRANSGVASIADQSQVEARLAKAHGNLLAAQNNLFDTHTQYMRIVGRSPEGVNFPRADITKIPYSLENAIDIALDNHPVIKIAQTDVESAKYQYRQTNGANLPTFTFEASQTWQDDASGIEGTRNETSAMLRMTYNIFNGGSDKSLTEQAAYQLNQAKDLRDRAYRNVEEGLRLSWSALDLTLQQKEFLADHVDAASETVIAYEKQYRIGKRTLLDLLNTENELFEARKDYVEAQFSEQYAKFRVMNATGTLLSSILVDIPDEWNQKVEY